MKKNLSLNVRLPAIISVLLLTLFAAIGFSVWASRAARNDTKIINIAGRQRMLSQKYTKEVLDELNDRQVLASAEQVASVATNQIVADRVQYTKNVIGKLKSEWGDFKAGADYHEVEQSIPLPATFLREVSEGLDESAGYRFDLLSKYNINKEKGLRDEFEKEAWRALAADPDAPHVEVLPLGEGLVLRYATADRAVAAGCVSCHNSHPDSPKSDFALGDLMGILVVTAPVTDDPEWAKAILSKNEGSGGSVYDKTLKLFNLSMSALLDGGETFSDLEMTQSIELAGTKDPGIRNQLSDARKKWEKVQLAVAELHSVPVGSAAYLDELRTLRIQNMETLKSVNEAVSMFQMASNARTTFATNVQYVMVALAITAFLAVVWFIRKKITNPLSAISVGIETSANQVASASGQVAQSSQSMADGAGAQASSLEETSASLEEMTSMTKQNAGNANQASSMAAEALNAAEKSRAAMERMSGAIKEIKSSSDQMANIIKTIDEIAFQTNLLALNAAVEAARAGDAGKGFAVVAEEVRNLAQRSAAAAKDTSELIEGARANADNGVAVSQEVGETLEQISDSVNKVTQLIGEVSSASNEQSQGIEQVNNAVSQMDKVTQSNAANSEEAAAASEELSAQAAELRTLVSDLTGIIGGSVAEEEVQREAPRLAPVERVAVSEQRVSGGPTSLLSDQRVITPEKVIPLDEDEPIDF